MIVKFTLFLPMAKSQLVLGGISNDAYEKRGLFCGAKIFFEWKTWKQPLPIAKLISNPARRGAY